MLPAHHLGERADGGEAMLVAERGLWRNSALPARFCCEPETALGNEVL